MKPWMAAFGGLILSVMGMHAQEVKVTPSSSPQSRFMRIATIDGHRFFQMAVTIYEIPKTGQTITFYAAVHIAATEYYRTLQKEFEGYDAVLMEGIGASEKYSGRHHPGLVGGFPQTSRERPAKESMNDLHEAYDKMADGLGFQQQLDAVDYRRGNFVYPDMTAAELKKRLDAAGVDYLIPEEQALQSALPLLRQLLPEGGSPGQKSSVLQNMIRNFMAEMILRLNFEEALQGTGEQDVKRRKYFEVILQERNRKVEEALARLLSKGDRKIAVFYGAMHLPDLEKRVEDRFGAKKASERWITAWQLN